MTTAGVDDPAEERQTNSRPVPLCPACRHRCACPLPTAYEAAGWKRLDDTSGDARVAEVSYEQHDRPKQLWVRALDDQGFRALRAPHLPPALLPLEKEPPRPRERCRVPTRRLVSLLDQLPTDVPDPRPPKGRWHPWRAVLAKLLATAQTLLPESLSPRREALQHPLYRGGGPGEKRGGARIEHGSIVRDVTPAELGRAGAAQLILLIWRVTENGVTTTSRNHLVTSRPRPAVRRRCRPARRGARSRRFLLPHVRLPLSQAARPTPLPTTS